MSESKPQDMIGKWVTPVYGTMGGYTHIYKCLELTKNGTVLICSAFTHMAPQFPAHYLSAFGMRLATEEEIAGAVALKLSGK